MGRDSRSRLRLAAALGAGLCSTLAHAATLPEHDPIDVLIVSDGVNPHGLSSAELTEPGDLQAAFAASDSGILTGSVEETDSGCVDDALAWLESGEPPDVLVYFAHQAAQLCAGGSAQTELVTLTEAHLAAGRGVLVFHHGLYVAAGKEAMLELLGMESNSIAWDMVEGQDVVSVAPDHFVSTHGMVYEMTRILPELPGVNANGYPAFNNMPDERYPVTTPLTLEGETRTVLFATASGTPRILGYDLQPPGLSGHVIAYQPGEHQPTILDERDGPNFQILANALLYLSGQAPTGEPPVGTGGAENLGGSPSAGGSSSAGGSPSSGGSATGVGGQAAAGGTAAASGGAVSGDGVPGAGPGAGGCAMRRGGGVPLAWFVACTLYVLLTAAWRRRT